MSDMNDIHIALINAKRAAEALGSWVRSVDQSRLGAWSHWLHRARNRRT